MRLRWLPGCLVLLIFLGFQSGFAQTSVTPANPLSLCAGGVAQTLSNITVSETANNGFMTQSGSTFILTAPSNFVFVSPGSVSVTPSSANITVTSITVTSSTITIGLNVSATAATDNFVISNLQVRAVSSAASGNILRLGAVSTGGTFAVNGAGGAARGSGVSYGSLTSVNPPTIANAGSDKDVCNTTTFSGVNGLTGNIPGIGTGAWSIVSGPGTLGSSPGTNPNSVVGNTSTTTARWTISNGVCPASTDDVVLYNRPAAATFTQGPNQENCNSGSFYMGGSDPFPGTGNWSIVSGTATIAAPGNPYTLVSGVPVGTSAILKWTVTNGSCGSSNGDVTLTNTTPPSNAAAGPDQENCSNSFTLAATPVTTGTGAWTIFSGSGSFGNAASPTSTLTTSTASVTARWTVTNGLVCPAKTDDVILTNRPPATSVSAGSNQILCNPTNFIMNASDPSPGVGSWAVTLGSATIASVNDRFSAVTVPVGTSATLSWTVNNLPCGPMSASVILTNTAPPSTANAGPDQENCSNVFNLNATPPTIGTGAWSLVSGTGTFGNAASATSTLTTSTPSFIARWTVTNGTCTASTDDVLLTNRPQAAIANAGINQTLCNPTSFIMNASDPSPGIGTWSVTLGSATIASANDRFSSVTVPVGTSATLQWTVTNLPCGPTNASVVLTNTAPPSTANAGPDQENCGNVFNLNAAPPTIGTGSWSLVTGTGTFGNAASPTSTLTTSTPSFTARWTVTNGTCTASADDVTLVNRPTAVTVTAGANQTLCNPTNFVLNGSDPTPGLGTWTVTLGSATIASPNDRFSSVTVPVGTSATLQWTVTNLPCGPGNASVILTNTAPPSTAFAGPDQENCSNLFTLNATTPATGTGSWSLVSGTGTFGNASSPTSSLTTSTPSFTARWTVTNGSCTASSDDVTLVNRPTAATVTAGANQTLCNPTNFVLNGSDPTPGLGTWSVTLGSATIASPNDRFSSVTVPVGTSATLQWTVTNLPCGPGNASVVLTNTAPPSTANAGPDQENCSNVFNLNATPPAIGTGSWSLVTGTGTFGNASSPTSTLTISTPSFTARWTVVNGSCTASFDDVVLVNRPPAAIANAGLDQTQCNSPNFNLNGSDPSPGTGLWTVTSGTATIAVASDRFTSVTVPAGSTATLNWKVTNGACPSTNDDVVLKNDQLPTIADAGPDKENCVSQLFSLSGNTPLIGTGMWSKVSGPGTIASPTSQNTSINGVTPGSTTVVRWTISNGSCAVSQDDAVLVVRDNISVSGGPNLFNCNNPNFTLAGSDPSPAAGTWTVTLGSATIVSPNNRFSPVTGVAPGTSATLTWTVSNGACGNIGSPVVLTNYALPSTADAGLDQDQCTPTSFTMAAAAPSSGTGTWTLVSGTGTFASPNSPTSLLNGVTGSVTARWTVSNGTCASNSDDVFLYYRPAVPAANAGSAQFQCNNGTFSLNGSAALTAVGTWSVVLGSATITSPNNRFSTVTGIAPGTSATLQWSINNGPCGTTNSSVVLTNYALPPTADANIDQSVCATTVTLQGNSPAPGTGAWTILSGSGGSFVSATNPTTNFSGTAGTTYNLRWTITNGVCSSYDDVTIQLKPTPNAAASGQVICSGTTTNILITNPNAVPGTSFNWIVQTVTNVTGATGGSGASINQTLSSTNGTSPGSVTYRITPVANGCFGNFVDAIVTVNPVPSTTANPLSTTVCSGLPISISLSNVPAVAGGVTFNWTVATLSGLPPTGASSGSGTTINPVLSTADNNPATIRYTITATANTGSCTGAPVTVDVLVKPVPNAQVAAGSTTAMCSGSTTAINLQNPNAVAGTTFSWTSSVTSGVVTGHSGGSGNSIAQTLTTNSGGGTVMYTITPVSNGCPGTPVTTSVVVNPVPAGNTVTTTAVCSKAAFSFAPTVSNGVATSYAWTVSYPAGLTGSASPGTGNITGNITNITGGTLSAVYTVTPTATSPGTCSGTPFTMTVPVNPEPVGTNSTETSVCSTAAFTYSPQTRISNGVSSTFAWTAVYDAGLTGGAASGSGNIAGTLTNVTNATLNAIYTIVPTAITGSCTGSSYTMTVPVQPMPKGADATPPSICSDASVGYNLQTNVNGVNGVPSNFSWLATTAGTVTGQSVTPKSGPIINDVISNVSGTDQLVEYTVTPASIAGCTGPTFKITVTIKSKPVGVSSTKSALCSGTPFNFDPQTNVAAGNNMNSTFAWTAAYAPGISGGSGSGTGHIIETLSNFTAASLNAVYTVIPTSVTGTCSGNAFTITVPVNPAPVGITQSVTRCSTALLGVTLTTTGGSVAAASYTISVSAPGGVTQSAGPSAGTGKSSSELMDDVWKNVTSVPQTVVYTITPVSAAGCSGNPFTVTLTLNPEPVGATDLVTRCSDIAVNYNLVNNVAVMGNNVGSTFSWKAISFGGATGASTSPVAGGVITDVLGNVTGVDQNVVYSVTPTSASGCAGIPFQVTITVHSKPKGTNAAFPTVPAICSGNTVNYNLQANVTAANNVNSSFSWVAAANPNVSGMSLTPKTTSVINDVLINTSGLFRDVVYTVTPTGTTFGCVGDPFTITVRVNPRAVISAGPDLGVCRNVPFKVIQGNISYAPNGYTWSVSPNVGSFSPSSSNVAQPSYTHANQTVTITLTALDPDGALGPCPVETDQMILKVNPLPTPFFTGLPASAAENDPVFTLNANKGHGQFTIAPGSGLGTTAIGADSLDHVTFDPAAAELGLNTVTYTFTDANTCTASTSQQILINAVTTITFSMPLPAVLNGSVLEICPNQGNVEFLGEPTPSDPSAKPLPSFTRFFVSDTLGVELPQYTVQIGQHYYLNTTSIPSSRYVITYIFENTAGAVSQFQRILRVFARPHAVPSVTNSCVKDDIFFFNNSYVEPSHFTTAAANTLTHHWFFDDLTESSVKEPSHHYNTPKDYQVYLNVKTVEGCVDTTRLLVRVGDTPLVNFSWKSICTNDQTVFKDLTKLSLTVSQVERYTWDFGDGVTISGARDSVINDPVRRLTGTMTDPKHEYLADATYSVTQKVLTDYGCQNQATKDVFILESPSESVTSAGYARNFDTDDGGWKFENLALTKNPGDTTFSQNPNTSWVWQKPDGTVINRAADGSAAAWWTGGNLTPKSNTKYYYPKEESALNGPCFNLTAIKRPMISLDYWSDTQQNFDGAVLQYSINGGDTWVNVGRSNEGINWYQNRSIVANPGYQSIEGWTGQTGGWVTARFNLDDVLNESQVRIRIAFGSDATNSDTGGTFFNGFAFDNFFIGEKERNVLVEHFTNANVNISRDADRYLDGLYQDEATLYQGASDFNILQYHVDNGDYDLLGLENVIDPKSRLAYMRGGDAPTTLMDGLFFKVGNNAIGNYNNITKITADRRSLMPPQFKLAIPSATVTANALSVKVDITADTVFNGQLLVQVVLVEDGVVKHVEKANSDITFDNVVRKHLFGSGGLTFSRAWTKGQTDSKTATGVFINVPIVDPSRLKLIAYIQDANTLEIYQSLIMDCPDGVTGQALYTGIDEPLFGADVKVYPNPASGTFNITVPGNLTPSATWTILDQRGVIILKGDFSGVQEGIKTIDIADFVSGLYVVNIGTSGRQQIHRKLIVVTKE